MKKRLAIYTCMWMMLVITAFGCTASSTSSPTASSDKASSQSDSKSKPKLSDRLLDAQIQINGDVYTVPCTFQDLFDKGWTTKDDVESKELPSLFGGAAGMDNGDAYMVVSFSNTTDERMMAVDSPIHQIDISAEFNTETEVMMPGGISFGATVQDLKAAYGEPDDEYLGSYYTTLTYELPGSHDTLIAQDYISLTVYDDIGLGAINLNQKVK